MDGRLASEPVSEVDQNNVDSKARFPVPRALAADMLFVGVARAAIEDGSQRAHVRENISRVYYHSHRMQDDLAQAGGLTDAFMAETIDGA